MLGITLILLPLVAGLPWWVALIGLVPLGTASLRSCPVYTLLGIRTCQMPGPDGDEVTDPRSSQTGHGDAMTETEFTPLLSSAAAC